MEQFNLFDAFGITPLDTTEKKDTAAKADKKPEKKTAPKKEAYKKSAGKDLVLKFPLKIKARGFNLTMESAESNKLSDLITTLIDNGYDELRLSVMRAVFDEIGGVLYFTLPTVKTTAAEDDLIKVPVTVIDGLKKAELSADDFPGKDEDEITADDVATKWADINPEYKGCSLIYQGDFCYPVFKGALKAGDTLMSGSDVLFCGEHISIDEDITVKAFGEHYVGNVKGLTLTMYHNLDKTCHFATFEGGEETKKNFDAAGSNTVKKAVTKYALPLKVHLSFGMERTLTPEDFSGKEKVSLDDIKAFFGNTYSVFKDTSRKMDVIYIKEENLLDIAFISGKKGADTAAHEGEYILFRDRKDLIALIKQGLYPKGNVVNRDGSYRVESYPCGTFLVKIDSETGKEIGLSFERRLPRIPISLLNGIKQHFEKDLHYEAMLSIFYHKPSRRFLLVEPQAEVTKVSVNYIIDPEILRDRNLIQVAQIHSHNTMPAIFSPVDNMDETIPLLYGVIGRLNEEKPQFALRAGFNGFFCDVPPETIFEDFDGEEWC